VFSAVDRGERAEDVLMRAGLVAGKDRVMDAAAGVTLRVFGMG
jgi:hypothetical protein